MNISELHEQFLESTGVCTDSRKIRHNCIFFALRGDNFNGNKYAAEAIEKGACKAVVDEASFHRDSGETILVDNVLETMQSLATYHRKHLGIPILALTGSNGKTTTKELINEVLSKKFRTTATKGNFNNHIGVPLTLLSMDENTQIGIVEMGANHQKEIEFLSAIALPDYGYITNFGKAHLEGFGGVEGVIKGKSELYRHIETHKKSVFVNANDPKQMELTANLKRYTFGGRSQDCDIILINDNGPLIVGFNKLEIHSNLVGRYNFHNIAAAIAIGNFFEVPAKLIKSAIESYRPENNRSQLLSKGNFSIILDAYNANPTSMVAAIENFKRQSASQKTYVLGDMFELGEAAASEHQAVVDLLESEKDSQVILVGENFFRTNTSGPHIRKYKTFDNLRGSWNELGLKKGKLLIKGSRGMALERLLEIIDD